MRTESVECPVYRQSCDNPDRIALRSDDHSISFAQLEKRIRHCAAKLGNAGVNANSRIAVVAENSILYATLIHATNRMGAMLVPINARYSDDMIKNCIRRSNCKLLLTDNEDMSLTGLSDFDHLSLTAVCQPDHHAATALSSSETSINLDHESTVMFTSGTGGEPKGVVLTYGNHYYSAIASNQNIQLQADDCWLAVLPFCHVGGYAVLDRTALAGCSAFIMSKFDPHRVNALIDDGIITHLSLVPTMLDSLLDERGERKMPAGLKAILIGGAPAARSLIDKAKSLPIMRTYGMTETSSQACTTPPNASFEKQRTSGRPLKHSEVAILDGCGLPVGDNQFGEIAVRGRILFKRYLGEDAGSSLDSNGWFHTGDVGHIDEDGYLCVSGRRDDMFISGGENIYPSEIESAALEFSGVSECAVIAVDDSDWGKRPILFVRWSNGAVRDCDLLGGHLRRQLPKFAMPDTILNVEEIPRKSIDKIDVERLREIYLSNSDYHD